MSPRTALRQKWAGYTVASLGVTMAVPDGLAYRFIWAEFAFGQWEDASLRYTGIDSHAGLTRYGLFDTVVARESVS